MQTLSDILVVVAGVSQQDILRMSEGGCFVLFGCSFAPPAVYSELLLQHVKRLSCSEFSCD